MIDEIDKGDLDLPGDLLEVLEYGEFEIPELARYEREAVDVREWSGHQHYTIVRGRVQCTEFPFIVMTSNGERDFPAPFLRRCIRFDMPSPTTEMIKAVVKAHLDLDAESGPAAHLVEEFVVRVRSGESLALDQLLNAVFLLSGEDSPTASQRDHLVQTLMRGLTCA